MARLLSRKEPLRRIPNGGPAPRRNHAPRTPLLPPELLPRPAPDRPRPLPDPGFPHAPRRPCRDRGSRLFPDADSNAPPLNRKRHRSRRTTPGLRPRPGFVRSRPPNSAPGPRPGSPRFAPDSPPSFFRRLFPKPFCGPSAPPLPKNAPRQSFPPSFRKSTGRFPPPFSLPRSPGSP